MLNALEEVATGNGWKFRVCRVEEILPAEAIDEALMIINQWAKVFPSQGTWIGDTYGVPSFIVRIDGMWDKVKGWRICEIEDRPCGLGTVPLINRAFAHRLWDFLQEWPGMRWVRDPDRKTDDDLWCGPSLSLAEALRHNGLLLVRARPEKTEYHNLENRSISTVSQEGNKACLADIGLAKIVRWIKNPSQEGEGYIDPPIRGSCVVKPIQGTRCRGVLICFDNDDVEHVTIRGRGKVAMFRGTPIIKRKGDTAGRDRVTAMVQRFGSALCQPFYMPMQFPYLPDHNVIYRLYFGYSPDSERYVPLGGVYNASPSLRIHGQDGCVFGPLNFLGPW